jgi:hypothetical protein
MASYDNTRDAARQLRDDAQGSAGEMRSDARSFFVSIAERFGVVGDDARSLATDVSAYLQHWARLVREDVAADLRAATGAAASGMAGGFVAAVGFLLLNMGIIWTLSSTDTGVGPWFVVFGVGWLVVGTVLALAALFGARRALRDTTERMREDFTLPGVHAKSISRTLQPEERHEPPTAH